MITWCNTRSSILLFFDYIDKDRCHYRNHLLANKGYLPGTRGILHIHLVTGHYQARVPRKPISANRGLNLANRGIHFVPRFDPVPESMINLNLGIN